MTKREKEILFNAEKSILKLREDIKRRGAELSDGEFIALVSGFFSGLGFALDAFNIETSEGFENEALASMTRIAD